MNQGLSIVIPALNEEENIPKLLEQLDHYFVSYDYEIILIDDFSDKKLEEVLDITLHPNLTISRNTFRLGQSDSIMNGIKLANFNTIGLIDGDGQNPPSELKKLYERYLSENNNEIAVIGKRLNRKDSLSKKIPSNIANFLLRFLTKTNSKDLGCSLKVFSKHLITDIDFQGDFHRFLTPLFEVRNIKTIEVGTNHNKREHGKSNYGIRRIFPVLIDGILFWLTKGDTKPSKYVLGNITLLFLSISIFSISWAVYQKIVLNAFIHRNPLFIIGVIFFIAALQFLSVIILKNKN
tara:strand:+ start:700 stop:1578 length:879 start_codon:yes stop_codon:yes gene_type:complete